MQAQKPDYNKPHKHITDKTGDVDVQLGISLLQEPKKNKQEKTPECSEYHTALVHTQTLRAHSVLSWEVKDSRVLRAREERHTRSTHTLYFHCAAGKLRQTQQASGLNFFHGSWAFKKRGGNIWVKSELMLPPQSAQNAIFCYSAPLFCNKYRWKPLALPLQTHILSLLGDCLISDLGGAGAASPLLSQTAPLVLAEESPPRASMVSKQALTSVRRHDFCDFIEHKNKHVLKRLVSKQMATIKNAFWIVKLRSTRLLGRHMQLAENRWKNSSSRRQHLIHEGHRFACPPFGALFLEQLI